MKKTKNAQTNHGKKKVKQPVDEENGEKIGRGASVSYEWHKKRWKVPETIMYLGTKISLDLSSIGTSHVQIRDPQLILNNFAIGYIIHYFQGYFDLFISYIKGLYLQH